MKTTIQACAFIVAVCLIIGSLGNVREQRAIAEENASLVDGIFSSGVPVVVLTPDGPEDVSQAADALLGGDLTFPSLPDPFATSESIYEAVTQGDNILLLTKAPEADHALVFVLNPATLD